MSSDVLTFGCRLNAYESEVMRGLSASVPDTVIVNTCAVTAEAERQARQAIRRLARERPEARIVVTGCAAQIDPAAWAALPNVQRVLGNDDKLKPESWLPEAGSAVSDIMAARETAAHLVTDFASRSRAFVQVQQGCDHRCTFCIIPFGRGPNRSVPIGVIAEQVRTLVAGGFREVVLTGVDIASYGPDLPGAPSLGQMIRRVLAAVPELPRLRLSSIDPAAIDADLWRLIGEEPRLMPHLHLSLQAGDDLILKRMKRRHSRADAVGFCAALRRARPEIVFGADLIAGFPTESDAMFENTLALIEDCGLTYLHVFPFSPRPGTPAAQMPQLESSVVKARARLLREAGAKALHRHLAAQIGKRLIVLTERGGIARTEDFTKVRVKDVAAGQLIATRITNHDGEILDAG